MTLLGASGGTESLEDEVPVDLKDLHKNPDDVTTSSSTEPQTTMLGHRSLSCSEWSIADAPDAADQSRGAEEPLLETGNGSVASSPDVTKPEADLAKDDDGVPYDRGWAWMIVLGQFVNFALVAGFIKSSGLIFVELLQRFQASTSHTALFFALRAATYSFSGFLVMNVLLDRFGARRLGLTGAILMSLSAILSSLTADLMTLICVHSILLGAGTSMLMSPGEVLMGKYFRKRRPLAISMAKCGVSLGNVVVPPLMTYMLGEFGLRGTLLLYGGVCLHSLPACLLHRPISYFSKQHHRSAVCKPHTSDAGPHTHKASRSQQANSENPREQKLEYFPKGKRKTDSQNPRKQKPDEFHQMLHASNSTVSTEDAHRNTDHRSDLVMSAPQDVVPEIVVSTEECDLATLAKSQPEFGVWSMSLPPPRKRTLSEIPEAVCRRKALAAGSRRDLLQTVSDSGVVRYLSVASLDGCLSTVIPLPSDSDGRHTQRHNTNTQHEHPQHSHAGICRRIQRSVLQCPKAFILTCGFSLFREPLFVLLMCFATFHNFVNITVDYLPAMALERGISESQSAVLLSVIGGVDFLCRLTTGVVANLSVVRPSTMMVISYVIVGIFTHFFTYMSTFPHFLVLAVLQGLFGGVGNCLYAVLVIDLLGLDNMGKGLGFCVLVSGATQALIYPFLGYIRDLTGSYAMTYHVIGVGILVAAVVVGVEGPVRKLQEKRHRRRQQQQQQQQQQKNSVP
ncbi:hypothetical protein ACOMHN_048050 [Nucella lapillus]